MVFAAETVSKDHKALNIRQAVREYYHHGAEEVDNEHRQVCEHGSHILETRRHQGERQ